MQAKNPGLLFSLIGINSKCKVEKRRRCGSKCVSLFVFLTPQFKLSHTHIESKY